MRRLRGLLAGLLLILSGPCLAEPAVVFHGNDVMLDTELVGGVLLAAMKLPANASATRPVADRAARRLRRYLRAQGYDRADVQVVAEDGVLHVFVDEGKFERISFHGQSSWKTVRLKLDLRLPEGAFNRLRVDREMARLKKTYAIRNLRWEVRESAGGLATKPEAVERKDMTVASLSDRELSSYELHVFVDDSSWGEGLKVGVDTGGPDGLRLDVSWSHDQLFFKADRYRLDTLVGTWLRRPLDAGDLRPVLTIAEQRLRWLTPSLIGDWLRLDVRAALGTRHVQRADLRIDSAWLWGFETLANVDFQPFPFLEATLGFGYRLDSAAPISLASGAGSVPADVRSRGVARAAATASKDSDTLRSDRKSFVTVVGEVDGLSGRGPVYLSSVDAKTAFDFGWDELILQGRAAWVGGPGVLWRDELSLSSDAFRVAPPRAGYARALTQAGVEYRFAVLHDTWKLGAFADASVHGGGTPGSVLQGRAGFASALGASTHVLFLDEFQLDAYYGGVLDQAARLGQGFMIVLRKIY